ncbi:LIM domain transcription factor LMO4.1-like [Amphibalanus amphitrite]|uniref:LIM domain transcription factor LMO4.1-like n=1 Tax=Amphibalanus amphitrite TaxID=1232801 RepID=UPI001C912E03|nr:LIM domain transcription factor LMO4.1-like [Amphibalanus amphitrite]
MNSVYPHNHFYSGACGGPGGGGPAGGGPGGPAGYPGGPRPPSGPQSPHLGPGKMAPLGGMNMNQANMMNSRLGGPMGGSGGGGGGGGTDDGEPKVCGGCGGRIVEKTMLHSMERYWHEACLRCSCCGVNLADSASCFKKADMILCKPDYVRMFGHCGVCAACGVGIPASEFVMRIGGGLVYHIRCFSCSKCNAALSRGDRYLLVNGAPVCEQDANKLFPPPVKKGKVGRPRRQRD